ncbi:MAG: FAD-dependent oxidoreductase, partial [Cucumibacter sp.]
MADLYDVIIIGSGPGGYIAAIRAAQLGLKTAIVEREHMGGVCLNWGCIPTKALLRTAEIYGQLGRARDYGLTVEKFGYDAAAIVKRSRGIAGQLANGVAFLMKKNKVDVIWGEGTISARGEVTVAKSKKTPMQPQPAQPKGVLPEGIYKAKNIVIATGARPRILPGIEPDGDLIWTYFEAMVPSEIPKSLSVMGSGAIGVEFASFYRSMGAEVTVVELLPQILPVEDAEIAARARKQMEKRGIKFLTDAKVTRIDKSKGKVTATVELKGGQKQTIEGEKLISAVGVVGNTENLGLEMLGVKVDRGIVSVDGFGATNVP